MRGSRSLLLKQAPGAATQMSIKRFLSLILALALTVLPVAGQSVKKPGDTRPSPHTYQGANTVLSLQTEMNGMRHEGHDYGKSTISLKSKTGKVLLSKEIADNYTCLGYSTARRAYILQTLGERISYRVVVAFSYVPEVKADVFYFNSFTGVEKYVASPEGIVPGPQLRYIAFVGQDKGAVDDSWRLYVLDTKRDKVILLGKAPDPPPFGADEVKLFKDQGRNVDPMDWNWMMMQSCSELEPTVCRFISANVLQVSYGRDSWRRRSKKRQVRIYTLPR